MSTESQHKLFNYEVTPPPTVWEKIAADLDDAALEFKFPLKLKEYSIVPPVGVWEKITNELGETQLKRTYSDKLYQIEVTPPKDTWSKIQSALEGESSDRFSEKKKIIPLLRYAAAAAIIGFITWASIQLINNNPGKKEIAEKGSIIIKESPDSEKKDQALKNEIKEKAIADILADTEEARNDAALEASKKTYAKLEINSNKKIKEVANFYFGESTLLGTTRGFNISDTSPTITETDHLENSASRYFLLITPDGNIIRMSKKLAGLVCCVSGEEQDKECKDQLKKWRVKMATTQTGHSPGNFMDILSLLNSLQEEN